MLVGRWEIHLRAAGSALDGLPAQVVDLDRAPVSAAPTVRPATTTRRRLGRVRVVAWTPDDPEPGDAPFPSLAGDAAVVIHTPDVATLEAFAHHARATDAIGHLTVHVAHWSPPIVGWAGRPMLPPGVVRWDLRLPAGRGPVRIVAGLTEPRPLRALLAAIIGTLVPSADLPASLSPALGAMGPAPDWLAVSGDSASRVPGLGLGSARLRGRDGDDEPATRLPLLDHELVMAGRAPAGLGSVPIPALEVTDQTIEQPATTHLLIDPRAVPPARWHMTPDAQDAGVTIAVVEGRVAWSGIQDGRPVTPWQPVAAPLGAPSLAWLRGLRSVTLTTGGSPDRTARDSDLEHGRDSEGERAAALDPAVAAGFVARLCLAGVVVDGSSLPEPVTALLSDELRGIVTAPLPDVADPFAWEVRSIGGRRAVVRGHAPRSSTLVGGGLPLVSVLLMTRRPEALGPVRAMLARQTYPAVEVLVGIHDDDAPLPVWDAASDPPTEAHRIPTSRTLGEGLGLLTTRARGTLVAKMDDDDIYGPEHVWDLVIGRLVSGATVVGKAAELVALDALGVTIRRTSMVSDDYARTVAGGTILVARGDLEALGGWRPVPAAVDRALLDRVLEHTGLIYRTWAPGFIYRRHDHDHTWDADASHFLRREHERWPGFPSHPEFGADVATPMASGASSTGSRAPVSEG